MLSKKKIFGSLPAGLQRGPAALRPVTWVPTLYLAKGLLVVMITCVTLVMGKRMGLSNTQAALWSSCLYLPFVAKPVFRLLFVTPLVRRWCVILSEFATALMLMRAGTCLTRDGGVPAAFMSLGLVALSGAMHNMAVDDLFYYQLRKTQRKAWAGVGLFFYNSATLLGLGLLIMLAGNIEVLTRNLGGAWSRAFAGAGAIYLLLSMWHMFGLPSSEPASVTSSVSPASLHRSVLTFWQKPGKWSALAFVLLYPVHESLLYRGAMLFMVDKGSSGGLSMGPQEIAFALGTVGAFAFMLGGLAGKVVVSRNGLKAWLWPMALTFTLSDLVYVYLSHSMPTDIIRISVLAFVEQFFSGFGLVAYLLFIIYFVRGDDKKSHYDLCLSLLALGVMFCGMVMGWLQDYMGYRNFFVMVLATSLLTYAVTAVVSIDPAYGKKSRDVDMHYPDGF